LKDLQESYFELSFKGTIELGRANAEKAFAAMSSKLERCYSGILSHLMKVRCIRN